MNRLWFWLLAVGISGITRMEGASKPRLLWELKFSTILAGGPGASKNLKVRDIAYSPDGNWIAAVVGPWRANRDSADDLVIIPSVGRIDRSKRIHLDHIAQSAFYVKTIFWSPDSAHVAVRLFITFLRSDFAIFRASDELPEYQGAGQEFLGFFDSHRFLIQPARTDPADEFQNRETSVYHLDGTRQVSWPFAATIRVATLGPPSIAAVKVRGDQGLLIVDPLTGGILRRNPFDLDERSRLIPDQGERYCGGFRLNPTFHEFSLGAAERSIALDSGHSSLWNHPCVASMSRRAVSFFVAFRSGTVSLSMLPEMPQC